MHFLPAQVILTDTAQCVGEVLTVPTQQPGSFVEVEGAVYAVLERRHRYSLRSGKYRLDKIALYVRPVEASIADRRLWQGQWVVGDPGCVYNAHSPLIRCATHPSGPCEGCRFYEAG